ncbi:hypothetical protein [Streptomyces sp. NPDC005009]
MSRNRPARHALRTAPAAAAVSVAAPMGRADETVLAAETRVLVGGREANDPWD